MSSDSSTDELQLGLFVQAYAAATSMILKSGKTYEMDASILLRNTHTCRTRTNEFETVSPNVPSYI